MERLLARNAAFVNEGNGEGGAGRGNGSVNEIAHALVELRDIE